MRPFYYDKLLPISSVSLNYSDCSDYSQTILVACVAS